jgi:hypothetical protein
MHVDLVVVNDHGEETVWKVDARDTVRMFTMRSIMIPDAIFFSSSGIRLPEDGNVLYLSYPDYRIHMSFPPTSILKRKYEQRFEVTNIPFLQHPENSKVLTWVTECCAEPDLPRSNMCVTLGSGDILISYSGGGRVSIIHEDGKTHKMRMSEWVSGLPEERFEQSFAEVYVEEGFVHLHAPRCQLRLPRARVKVLDDDTERDASPIMDAKRIKTNVDDGMNTIKQNRYITHETAYMTTANTTVEEEQM